MEMMSNLIHLNQRDLITGTCPKFNGGLVKPPLKLGRGRVITPTWGNECDCPSMPKSKLNHVSKWGPRYIEAQFSVQGFADKYLREVIWQSVATSVTVPLDGFKGNWSNDNRCQMVSSHSMKQIQLFFSHKTVSTVSFFVTDVHRDVTLFRYSLTSGFKKPHQWEEFPTFTTSLITSQRWPRLLRFWKVSKF